MKSGKIADFPAPVLEALAVSNIRLDGLTVGELCFSALSHTMSVNGITLRLCDMDTLQKQLGTPQARSSMRATLAPHLAVQDRTLGVIVQMLTQSVHEGAFAQAAGLLRQLQAPDRKPHNAQQWASLFPALGSSAPGMEAALAATAAAGDMHLAGQLLAVASAFDLQITQHMAQSLIMCAHSAGDFTAATAVASLALRLPGESESEPPLQAFVCAPLAWGDTRAALSAFKVACILQYELQHGELPEGLAVEMQLPGAGNAGKPPATPQAASYAEYLSQLNAGSPSNSTSSSDGSMGSALPVSSPSSAGAAGLLAAFPTQAALDDCSADTGGGGSGDEADSQLQHVPVHSVAHDVFDPTRYFAVGEPFPGSHLAAARVVAAAAANGGTATEALCDAVAQWAQAHGFHSNATVASALLQGYAARGAWSKALRLVGQLCGVTQDETHVPDAVLAYIESIQRRGAWNAALDVLEAAESCSWSAPLQACVMHAALAQVEDWAAGQDIESTAQALQDSDEMLTDFIQQAWRSHATPGAIAAAEERGWAYDQPDSSKAAANRAERQEQQTQALAQVARAHACASFNADYSSVQEAVVQGSTVGGLALATRLALECGDVETHQRLLRLCAQNGWSSIAAKVSRALAASFGPVAHESIVARLQCLTASVGGLARLLLAVHKVQQASGTVPASMRATLQQEAQMHIDTARRCPRTTEPLAAASTARFLSLSAGRLHRGAMSVLQADSTHRTLSKAESKAGVRWSPQNVEHTLRLRAPDLPGGALLASAGLALEMRDMDTATALVQYAPSLEPHTSSAAFRMLVQPHQDTAEELSHQVVAGAVFAAAVRATQASEALPRAVLQLDLSSMPLHNARDLCLGAVLYSCVQQQDWSAVVSVLRRSSSSSSDAAQAVLTACDDGELPLPSALRAAQLVQWHYSDSVSVRHLLLQHTSAWLAEAAACMRDEGDEGGADLKQGGGALQSYSAPDEMVAAMFPCTAPLTVSLARVSECQGSSASPLVRAALHTVSAACNCVAAAPSGDRRNARRTAEQVCSAALNMAASVSDAAAAHAVCAAMLELGLCPEADVATRLAPLLQHAGHYDTARWAATSQIVSGSSLQSAVPTGGQHTAVALSQSAGHWGARKVHVEDR